MRPHSRQQSAAILAVALASALFGLPAAHSAPPQDLAVGATVSDANVAATTASYPYFDARGRKLGMQPWTVTSAGGNCCEVYVAATPTGRLLEFGGTYPYFSDDRGKSWKVVKPLNPLYNGEGAIVAGPQGDVYAVAWDPYTGDHLEAFKYTAKTKLWEVAEAPLHSPFYDREWIGIAKGPFIINGQQYPIATVITGGGVTKEESLISGDGLTYVTPSSQALDEIRNAAKAGGAVPVARDKDVDWMQGHADAGFTPLTRHGLLQTVTEDGNCSLYRLRSDATWECFNLAGGVAGHAITRQDSRGWLQQVTTSGNSVVLRVSTDGGKSYHTTIADAPTNGKIDFADVKVSGALGKTVVDVHVNKGTTAQDEVLVFDTHKPQAVFTRTYFVGKGDLSSISGVVGALSDRMDFASVAMLPDGKLAVSFDDSSTSNPTATKPAGHSPELAVQR